MIQVIRRELSTMLPLKIHQVSFEDPSLSIQGQSWSLNAICCWRLATPKTLVASPEALGRLGELSGDSIVSVQSQSRVSSYDPAFECASGMWIELFTDHWTDPWVMHLPHVTLVGSGSEIAE
jgi:hypothetical protein